MGTSVFLFGVSSYFIREDYPRKVEHLAFTFTGKWMLLRCFAASNIGPNELKSKLVKVTSISNFLK